MGKKFTRCLLDMKFFLDENLPRSLTKDLAKLGFEVSHAAETGLRGSSDYAIADYAKKQNAILITKDLEFGSPLLYPKETHYGLLVLRLPHWFDRKAIAENLIRFLQRIEPPDLVHKIVILEVGRYRIRDLR